MSANGGQDFFPALLRRHKDDKSARRTRRAEHVADSVSTCFYVKDGYGTRLVLLEEPYTLPWDQNVTQSKT